MDSDTATISERRNAPEFSFSGSIEPTRLPPAYRFGLVVVAVAMLLLPIVYLAFIVLTGVTVWWHVTANTWILSGGSMQWRLLAYLTPAVVGLVLLFFMVKPILARPAGRQAPLPIAREAEPALFAFIEDICRNVCAPLPRRVEVDCQVNASAGFMPERFGMFKRDLVLTVGLPLVAGLSVREFGGVLAHEFGHFTQGGGMRLTALVRSIDGWFARVVLERDAWDERLERWAKENDWRVTLPLLMASVAVWMSRHLLMGLMMAGHAISCFMMRQMEYDADGYEVKVAGSAAFVRTMVRLRELNLGVQFGYGDLRQVWLTGALPSNLPVFLVERCARIPDDLRSQIGQISTEYTRVFDTHPSDGDRVRRAEAAAVPGILVVGDLPATQLFGDFDALSAAATRHHYEHDLGLSLDALRFVDTDVAIQESKEREDTREAFQGFFAESASLYRPIRVETASADSDPAELWRSLCEARDRMVAAGPRFSERYRRFEWLTLRHQKAFAAQELLAVGFATVNADEFDLAQGTAEEARSTAAWALEEQQALIPVLEKFEEAAGRRLSCAMCLWRYASGRKRPRDDDDRSTDTSTVDVMALGETLNAIANVMVHLHDLHRFMNAGSVLVRYRSVSNDPVAFNRRIPDIDRSIASVLQRLRDGLTGVPCPASFTSEPMDVAKWCGLLRVDPPPTAAEVDHRIATLYFGVLGRLAAVALQVEASHNPVAT